MERQHKIFIAVAGAIFLALIVLAFYKPLQNSGNAAGNNSSSSADVRAKKGQEVYIRYSPSVVKLIQGLPSKNTVEIEVSSELQVTNFAGLNGELRYPGMTITYVQNGKEHNVTDTEFKSVEYRFSPDAGNKTKYTYESVKFIGNAQDSQITVAVKSLFTAKVGQKYTVKLVLHNGAINYALDEKIVQIVA